MPHEAPAAPSAHASAPPPVSRGALRSIGPAMIIACVVLGPGSILLASRVGAEHGYSMGWLLALAGVLMGGMVALGARLGVVLTNTPCQEIAVRLGRPAAAALGILLFLIIASFQSSNNIAVLAATEALMPRPLGTGESLAVLVALNGLIVAVLLGFRRLYKPIEWMMLAFVVVMVIGFVGNLAFARPAPLGVLRGLVPSLPREGASWLPLVGLVGTTFSISAAFYQGYLVREKGWTMSHLRRGLVDAAAGISVLTLLTLIIMATSAAVLVGKAQELKSAADVARQIEPLFGPWARILFALGLFAAAFSSFMVNAMAGGTLLSDGLGFGGAMDRWGPKIGTILALMAGMAVAVVTTTTDSEFGKVGLIVIAQALTVIGGPLLALTLLWLATRGDLCGPRRIPLWMKIFAIAGCLGTIPLAIRAAHSVYTSLQNFWNT